MQGFIRTTYDDGYKYTMIYPPGWKRGDPRQPEVHKEPCVPGLPNPSVGESNLAFEQRPSGYFERGHLPDRLPRSAAARPRQPMQAGARSGAMGHGFPEGLQSVQSKAWSHPLQAYLAQAWMPAYELGTQVDASVRYEWPFLRVLVRAPGTRELYLVQRIFDWDLRHEVTSVKQALGDAQLTSALVEQGKLADLTLPDTACCSLCENDARFLDSCRLATPSDVTKLVQAYPVRTVIKAIKLFLGIPDEHKISGLLKFNDVNHLCPVRNAGLFDLIAMPGCGQDELSILMVVVPPWDFKYDDLEEFGRVGVPDGDLDLVSNVSPFPCDVLWAVIWDICTKHACRYFVLTTYEEWVFGTLSSDMHRARVTRHVRAPIFPRDMAVSAKDVAQPRFPVPNVFEMLMLWILAAVDTEHTWWPQPPDLPDPVDPSQLSILAGGWKDLETGF